MFNLKEGGRKLRYSKGQELSYSYIYIYIFKGAREEFKKKKEKNGDKTT
jgi:hypothetical protein